MAKKKATPEELIVSFFTTAELPSATTLFNVVKGLMNTRTATTTVAATKKASTRASKNSTNTTTAAPAAAAPAAVAE
jgi:hypothetical protein